MDTSYKNFRWDKLTRITDQAFVETDFSGADFDNALFENCTFEGCLFEKDQSNHLMSRTLILVPHTAKKKLNAASAHAAADKLREAKWNKLAVPIELSQASTTP
jgi:uncharacterized protein YjbI with pentapeptide repeats